MYRQHVRKLPFSLFALAASLLPPLAAQGTPIGFVETWALALDRREAIATLIPGT
jgi:hypothetical protein